MNKFILDSFCFILKLNNIFIYVFVYHFNIRSYFIFISKLNFKNGLIYKSKYEYFKILFKAVLKLTILVSINLNL